jgi:hypothetical protein
VNGRISTNYLLDIIMPNMPQWSPPKTGGMARQQTLRGVAGDHAPMEPAGGRRGDLFVVVPDPRVLIAAMEPARGEGDDGSDHVAVDYQPWPQWNCRSQAG